MAQFFAAHGFKFLCHSYRTKHFEIDLVFYSPRKEWTLIEVKSIRTDWSLGERLNHRQRQRLESGFDYFQGHLPKASIRFHLATVDRRGKVQVFTDVLSEAF